MAKKLNLGTRNSEFVDSSFSVSCTTTKLPSLIPAEVWLNANHSSNSGQRKICYNQGPGQHRPKSGILCLRGESFEIIENDPLPMWRRVVVLWTWRAVFPCWMSERPWKQVPPYGHEKETVRLNFESTSLCDAVRVKIQPPVRYHPYDTKETTGTCLCYNKRSIGTIQTIHYLFVYIVMSLNTLVCST